MRVKAPADCPFCSSCLHDMEEQRVEGSLTAPNFLQVLSHACRFRVRRWVDRSGTERKRAQEPSGTLVDEKVVCVAKSEGDQPLTASAKRNECSNTLMKIIKHSYLQTTFDSGFACFYFNYYVYFQTQICLETYVFITGCFQLWSLRLLGLCRL